MILVLPSSRASFRMRIFNADGSEAEMCGNGIRCLAKYVYERVIGVYLFLGLFAVLLWWARYSLPGFVLGGQARLLPLPQGERLKIIGAIERAGISLRPRLYVYPSNYINVLLFGFRRDRLHLCISSRLMEKAEKCPECFKAALAHELAHVINGDVCLLSLLGALCSRPLAALVMFIPQVLSVLLSNELICRVGVATLGRGGLKSLLNVEALLSLVSEYFSSMSGVVVKVGYGFLALWLLYLLVDRYVRRRRELMADFVAARLVGRESMRSLFRELIVELYGGGGRRIGRAERAIMKFLSSHPPFPSRMKTVLGWEPKAGPVSAVLLSLFSSLILLTSAGYALHMFTGMDVGSISWEPLVIPMLLIVSYTSAASSRRPLVTLLILILLYILPGLSAYLTGLATPDMAEIGLRVGVTILGYVAFRIRSRGY